MTTKKDTGSGKPRREKLGVKPAQTVALAGAFDASVRADLKALGARVVDDPAAADWVLLACADATWAPRLLELASAIKDEAAIWAVWTKGDRALNENHVRNEALSCGLVDVKVMSWDATHSALKLVRRAANRAAKAKRR